jgi:hypothetical protein
MRGSINYLQPMSVRPAFFAHDFSRDNLELDAQSVEIRNARTGADAPSLAREGFTLVRHRSAVSDFRDSAQVQQIYLPEAERLLREITGAKRVIMMRGAVPRFSERSKDYRTSFNSRPARFTHVDYTERSAPGLLQSLLATVAPDFKPRGRYAGYNLWRVLSEPPQDVPLGVCDARSVEAGDLVPADAVFDAPGAPEFRFEAYLLRHNPRHRWFYFPNMTRDEALVFKAYDTDASQPLRVPHCAFDDPNCPKDVAPRASIEVRGFAFFDD